VPIKTTQREQSLVLTNTDVMINGETSLYQKDRLNSNPRRQTPRISPESLRVASGDFGSGRLPMSEEGQGGREEGLRGRRAVRYQFSLVFGSVRVSSSTLGSGAVFIVQCSVWYSDVF